MPDDPRVDAFKQLCRDQAVLWRLGEWEALGDAVDPLQAWAESNELVRLIGQDEIQTVIATAFAKPIDPWTESAKAWRAEHPVAAHPVGPVPASCEHCNPGPCRFPTFCGAGEQANRWWAKIPANHPFRRGRGNA